MEALMTGIDNKKTGRSKILIVEDHEGIRSSMKQWISTVLQDYEIRDVNTGEDAVAVCREIKPDLVLMDIKLPGINGIQATIQIKKILPETKVVILTIYDTPVFKASALEAGASAFLSKNNMYKELIPTIQRLIS
jgi:DNA-binding NarL/FixJ family response regulator